MSPALRPQNRGCRIAGILGRRHILASLFRDEQRWIVNGIVQSIIEEADNSLLPCHADGFPEHSDLEQSREWLKLFLVLGEL